MNPKIPEQTGEQADTASSTRPAATPARAARREAATLDMSVNIAGIALKNPIMAASGTFGYGIEFEDIVSLEKLGGFVVKGLSREAMPGNPPPRLFETAAGMLNAIGLQNIGARAFVEEKLPALRKIKDTVVIANVYGYCVDDYEATIRILNEAEGIAAYELNVSCPNVRYGGIAFGQDAALLSEVVAGARGASTRPLIVKLSPNVTSIAHMARAAEDAGADAISLVNTFLAMAIDPVTRRPRISNVTAGLSGPAIKPIAVRMVYEVAQAVKIPVIGMGGISTPEDVVEFLLAGATAVEVGTANFWDPRACERLVKQLERWCLEQQITSVAGLRGGLILA
jgi:dihydroorotate dehydrogenase (NAD+) catalytic subunit